MDAKDHAECCREALADLEALEAQRVELLAVVNYHRKKAEISERSASIAPVSQVASSSKASFGDMTHKEAAEVVLRKANRPMSTTEITDKIIAAGYPCKDKAIFRNSLFARMSKSPEVFQRIGRGIWKLASSDTFDVPTGEELFGTEPEEPVGVAGVTSTRHANGRL